MPLDDTTGFLAVPAETVPDLSQQSLEALAYVLEHVDTWPIVKGGERWRWDFTKCVNECGTAGCALGIAGAIWRQPLFDRGDVQDLGWMSFARSEEVFVFGDHDPAITAAVVAGRIRDHLAGRSIRYLVEGDRS